MTSADVIELPTTKPEPLSPEWWRDRLVRTLLRERPAQMARIAWYLGLQPVPEITDSSVKKMYRLLLDMSRNAWARLVIDAIAERTTVTGVRIDGTDADLEVWDLLKGAHFDVDQRLVHSESLTLKTSYFSVMERDGEVSIAPESALQVTHENDPTDRRTVRAALKLWEDDTTSEVFASLFVPGVEHRWKAPRPGSWASHQEGSVQTLDQQVTSLEWEPLDERENGYSVVPIFPLSNRPTLFAGPQSEIDDLVPVFQRIDKVTLDMLVTSHAASFKQRWVTGMKIPVDPATNEPVEPFEAAVAKLWVSPSTDTTFGQFDSSPMDPYLKVIDAAVAQVSAISRVPSYYLVSPNLVNPPSADTMMAAETGLIKKARSLLRVWGEQYEAMVRLALVIAGDDRDTTRLEIVWENPAQPSEAQVADAALKWATLGVPNQALWEKGGATPEEIARWKSMAAAAEVEKRLLNQIAPNPTPVVGEPTEDEPPTEDEGPEAFE